MIFVNVLSKMQQTQSVALVKLLPKIRAFLSFFFRARVTEFAYSRLIRANMGSLLEGAGHIVKKKSPRHVTSRAKGESQTPRDQARLPAPPKNCRTGTT